MQTEHSYTLTNKILERERQRDRETERQTQRERDTHTHTHTDRQTHTERDTHTHTEREREREREREGREAERNRNRRSEVVKSSSISCCNICISSSELFSQLKSCDRNIAWMISLSAIKAFCIWKRE